MNNMTNSIVIYDTFGDKEIGECVTYDFENDIVWVHIANPDSFVGVSFFMPAEDFRKILGARPVD